MSKTGTVDTSVKTVTWTITATEGSTTSGHLIVVGYMAVTNSGTSPATIGNIVVNLQTKSGSSWVTRSSNIADATNDNAATIAHIDSHARSEGLAIFTENTASGQLKFMDANTNTVFSLVPEKTIAPGATVNLLFAASFDNNVLALPVGKRARAEVIASFGNAKSSSPSAPNIDINGNGVIDLDEAWVRSIPARLGLTVPAQQSANSNPTITDTVNDIATTGTVTFSNAVFNIGATSGTVTVHYDGGTSGGEITNCACLTGTGLTTTVGGFAFPNVTGVDLEACDTETIGSATCTPGAPGCGWSNGNENSYTQLNWDTSGGGATLLSNNYSAVYASNAGLLEVGIVSATAYSMSFTGASAVLAYLPATGTNGALSGDLVDPTSSSTGTFGGDSVALKLNIDFSDAGYLLHTSTTALGDLLLCNVTPSGLNGSSVRQLLNAGNIALSGGATPYSYDDLDALIADVNAAFVGGTPSTFAQSHLFVGACP